MSARECERCGADVDQLVDGTTVHALSGDVECEVDETSGPTLAGGLDGIIFTFGEECTGDTLAVYLFQHLARAGCCIGLNGSDVEAKSVSTDGLTVATWDDETGRGTPGTQREVPWAEVLHVHVH